ncbi:MAG: hypothetical protein IKB01_04505 [Lachnospiraceae bacterium]|nr:hypothetical protein [Lachnospiraceae bacterium]MBR3684047.1 hypothetical protein [Lachnospiraceae bacterium]
MKDYKRVLVTAFRGSSAELLVKNSQEYRTLILPNDKVKDSELLINAVSNRNFDYIISFGQRPNIKNKVHIETTAKDSELQVDTKFDCDRLVQLFEQNGITSKISHNAGTSFCNQLYLNGLKYVLQNNLDTKMVFIHIPFLKNIDDVNDFYKRILNTLAKI